MVRLCSMETKLNLKGRFVFHLAWKPYVYIKAFASYLLLGILGMLTNHSFQVLYYIFIYIGIQILLWPGN